MATKKIQKPKQRRRLHIFGSKFLTGAAARAFLANGWEVTQSSLWEDKKAKDYDFILVLDAFYDNAFYRGVIKLKGISVIWIGFSNPFNGNITKPNYFTFYMFPIVIWDAIVREAEKILQSAKK